jgi:PAS domain S-box-containing protein
MQKRDADPKKTKALQKRVSPKSGTRRSAVKPGLEMPAFSSRREESALPRGKAEMKEQPHRRTAEKKSAVRELENQAAKAKELEKRIAHLASFPELNPNPVVEIDFSGQVYYQNPAARRLFPDLSIQGASDPFLAGVAALIAASQKQKDISLAREQEVGPSWYHQSIFYSSQWNRIRIYGFDITEKKKAEDAIRESERKFRELFEGSQDGYAQVDLKGNILEFNAAFQRMLGYTEGELKRRSILDLTPKKWHDLEKDIIQSQVIPHGYSKVYEKEYRRKDGTVFPVSLRTYRLEDAKGNPHGRWAFIRDITERKRMEESLASANERLTILSEISARLLESEKPQEVVEELCRKVMDHLDCHACFNYLVDEEKQRLHLNAYAGIPDEEARKIEWLNFGDAVCGCAARDGVRIVAENIPETLAPRTDLARSFGIKAYASHPLLSQGKVIGTLAFGTRSRLSFSEDELSLMKTVGDQVSIAMERIRLYKAAGRRAEELDRMVQERTQDLRKTNEILEGVFSNIDLLVAHMDRDFNFIRVNRAYAEADGRPPEFYIGKNHFALFPDEENEEIFRRVVETGEPYSVVEKAFTYADHPERGVTYWDWSLHPVKEADGRVDGVVLSMVNVTERKQAEGALKRSSLYTRSLIEASLDPLVTISPEGKITDVNRATEMATGVPREDLIGSDFSNYFTEPKKAREGYERVFKEGAVLDYPLAIRHVAGKVADVLYNATVYRNEAGEVQGVFAAARDITERKQAEEAWRQNERLLRNILELLPVGVWIADKNGFITYGNPAGQRIWAGYRYVGVEQFGEYKGWWLDTGKRIEPEEWGVTRAIRKGEISLNEEIEIECFDGSHKFILNSVIPLRNEKNEISGAFVINDDLTERRRTEQTIRQMQKMEALGTLAGGIAHDFNNILMPITINAEMALLDVKEGTLPPASYLQLIREAANRGQGLVKQIITFSRQKEQPRQPIEIIPVIKEALKFLRAMIPKSIEIRPSIGVESAVISADPTQVHQVLMNLCNNAAYAMREKGGVLEVNLAKVEVDPEAADRVPELKPQPYLRLTVRDTGHGMGREVRERAFDPFFTTKKPGEGAGMGLAVVHGIVKNHEGIITLESEVGRGTTARVFFPLLETARESEVVSPDPIPGGDERILLIDDEEIQILSLKQMLERLGYRVTGKKDPREALEVFRNQPGAFDLVITDQTMPELTGAALVQEMLRLRPDLPVILYTGFSETIDEEQARALGVRDFALKPLSMRDLAERIRKVLKK